MGMLFPCLPVLVVFIALMEPQIGASPQVPKFLQNKYGTQSASPSPYGSSTKYYSKTKVTSKGTNKSHATSSPYKTKTLGSGSGINYSGGCTSMPSPMNAGVRCSQFSGCRAECMPNFKFPNGKTNLRLNCVDGNWVDTNNEFTSVPNCQPVCLPPCQNNGICLGPNQCSCQKNFSGPQCQFESKPCLNHPPMPMSSKRSCNSKKCTITCMPGHEFPDGSSIATMDCKNGMWTPSKEKWVSIPDCRATCDPPCQNGGNCLSFNVCQCPRDFRGPQCQYDASACSAKKLEFNGGYNCSGDANTFSCSISCPPGIEFEFPAESVYTCTYDLGFFLPLPVPKCVYPEFSEVIINEGISDTKMMINESKYDSSSSNSLESQLNKQSSYGSGSYSGESIFSNSGENGRESVIIEKKLPKPGTCFSWGGSHYKTFDDRVYSFNSMCPHVLVRDSIDGTFSIITENDKSCQEDPEQCHKIINIYIQNANYVLNRTPEGIPTFKKGNKTLPVPGRVPGVRVEMLADNILLSLDTVGVEVLWDGELLLQVSVKESSWNRTEGLCGNLDGDESNDILTKEGNRPRNIITLATSWQIDVLSNRCDSLPSEDSICTSNTERSEAAAQFCNKLITDNRFKLCQNVLDITSLYDACRSDFCKCYDADPTYCACQTFDVYVKHCSHFGIAALANWRDENTCPLRCTNGKVYKACGSSARQPACGSITEGVIVANAGCVEGCFCPEGTVLHEDKCITKDKCPCSLRGKSFAPGASVPKDCNTCTCNDGQWICTQIDCGARCSAIGDPHYVTFDGKKFDFMGRCSYYLVKNSNFSIEAENVPCPGAFSEGMNFPTSLMSGMPTCTKTVTIRINDQVVKLKQNHALVINGEDVNKFPINIGGIKIKRASSIFSLTTLPNNITVWWDGSNRVYIDLPAKFKEETHGLCGSFNNNQKDDFLTPQDDIEQAVIPFANKWKTSETCPDLPEVIPTHPCDKNIHKRSHAEKYCSKIKQDLFKDCHFFVDADQFYQDCLYDMCSCELPVSKCLCPIIASYATECSRKGINVDWRSEIRECGLHCPGGQKYQVCGNSCTRTCFDIREEPNCKPQCIEGCNCPEGQTLDENGECISIGQCKCWYGGLEFPPEYREIRPASKRPELCTCTNALWDCQEADEDDIKTYPSASLIQNKCNASANMEFTTCEPVEPITCKNMHSPELYSPAICHAGCQCKNGYVLDTSTRTCVKPTQCPCHHANKSYKELAVVQSGCNTCTCTNGKWACTDRQCAGECSAWGDSHYKTFDGKRYDYQGECDYVLSKGRLGSDSYHVSVQNVPCGSLGTACFKSVTIKVTSGDGSDVITLEKDKTLPSLKTFKHITLRQKSSFVIVEAPELGLVVHWDKGTRVYVRLHPRWKGQTKGLCGNYNDNEMDDFQTPSGGLAEVSPTLFGDSWRLQSYCTEALEIQDTCESRPDRKIWAIKKCNILKSPVFAPCHYEVPVEYYFDKCTFDTCACDQGGDCECLCTALAAYAQECNNRGVAIKWRTPEFCPMQCDEQCTTYSPCMSTCPEETCDNLLMNKKYSKTCAEDVCIEGCAPKPCPPGQVYSNSTHSECVPMKDCRPICLVVNNVTYYEGDLMEEDECHSCYCSREEKKCRGEPCTTTAEPSTTLQNEQFVQCQQGWTEWINQNVQSDEGQLGATEIEPVPSSLVMLNLQGSAKCGPEMVKSIECRTVKGHVPAKQTGLDVECSLERGLVCESPEKEKLCPDFEIRVECDCGLTTTPIPETTTEIEITTTAPKCLVGESKEDEDDCTKYYICAFGTNENRWVQETCAKGTLYNTLKKMCDWPKVVYPIRPSCVSIITETTSQSTTQSTTETSTVTELFTMAPSCIIGEMREDELDCSVYYICAPDVNGNRWVQQSCGPDTLYNPMTKVCDWSQKVLDIKPTCEEIATIEPIAPTACPPGTIMDKCAIQCDKMCMYYGHLIKKKGLCKGNVKCEEGCVSAERTKTCPQGSLWLNENTCVSLESCMCVSEDGKPLKPGKVYDEPGCKKCQCIDNSYSCQPGLCTTKKASAATEDVDEEITETTERIKTTTSEVATTTMKEWTAKKSSIGLLSTQDEDEEVTETSFTKKIIAGEDKEFGTAIMRKHTTFAIPSVTPPAECTDDRFVPLIQGDSPLSDTAFKASSVKEDIFAPQNARLDAEVSEESGGSWAPKYQNQDQYLEINLGKQEPVYGVIVRGSPLYDEYVTSYRVLYSPDGHTFYYILDKNTKKPIIFRGSTDSTTEVKQYFDEPIEAKIVRINPKSWNNGISLQVELVGCAESTTETTKAFKSTTHIMIKTTQTPQFCDDPMGLDDGSMPLSQVSVSSSISSQHDKSHSKLSDDSAWQPLTNSLTEWIKFNFLEPRDITGIVTKGGPDGWVENYIVQYSNDEKTWSTIMYGKEDKLFAGNFLSNIPQVNNFELPIRTQYVRVVPKKWKNNIQMRVEIHGCYEPYPTETTEQPVSTASSKLLEDACEYCPGIPDKSLELDACRCLSGLLWDGNNCVNRTECPCLVGFMQYPVGSIYEEEDCSECICKIGGVPFCTPKRCGPCEEGLRSAVTSTCACSCKPCPSGTTLCPTSNVCINSTSWCDGIQDCPDDETDCVSTTEATTTTTTEEPSTHSEITKVIGTTTSSEGRVKPTIRCKEVVCEKGYEKVVKKKNKKGGNRYMSQMLRNSNVKTAGTKTRYLGVKGGRGASKTSPKKWTLSTPSPRSSAVKNPHQQKECVEYVCVPAFPQDLTSKEAIEYCPPPECQQGYVLILDDTDSEDDCQTFSCNPPPEPDAVCKVTGRTFNTFDKVEYKYDICNHVLARDLQYESWEIMLKKNCTQVCSRDLVIQHDLQTIVLHPDFTVEYDGYTYSLNQAIKVSEKQEDFSITSIGNTVLFTSQKYGFWVLWNKNGDVKIGVDQELLEKVDGLCGYFDGERKGDKRRPDGSLSKTTVDFGDSWALSNDQPQICEAKACPIEMQNEAWKMCNKVKEQSLEKCGHAVDVEAFISRCLETACTCLERSRDNSTSDENCKCSALQSFVVECLSTNPDIDIANWRVEQNCPAPCDAPLTYNDCYQRRCEPNCATFSDPKACPKVNDMCFPGCYCPAGYVREGKNCIQPSSCRNCECNLLPRLTYVTYDQNNFTVSGNCVYVMSRDVITKDNEQHQFQVLVTNHPCSNTKSSKGKMCVGKITILYEQHKIHILKNVRKDKLKIIFDGEVLEDFTEVADVVDVQESQRRDLSVLLKRIQVVVKVTYPNLEVRVLAPSYTFGGKLEGICGDCNGRTEDDFKKPDGKKPEDETDFGLSWLYQDLPGGQNREECEERKEEDKCRLKPDQTDPCVQLLDENKFGQCSNIIDPSMYLDWCRKDVCESDSGASCESLEAYAKECSTNGFCINWRNDLCPAPDCPPGQIYSPCGPANPETCENRGASEGKFKFEGCFCPEGKVLSNGTCVEPRECITCDNEGHHPGDAWKKDKCTTCKCDDSKLSCETQQCVDPSTLCERNYNAVKVPTGDDECCDKFTCIPEPTFSPTCEPPQNLQCAKDQVLKLETKPSGCQVYICECKPKEECPEIDLSTITAEPGYIKEIDDTSSCCPSVNFVCKKETCPPPDKCPQFYTIQIDQDENKCCPTYSCEAPEKCIVQTEHGAASEGGERPLTDLEKQKVLKSSNETWKDGPCRDCKCTVSDDGKFTPTCSKMSCPDATKESDWEEYELVTEKVYDECCPKFVRHACKYNGEIYNVGESWFKENDYCTSMRCVKSDTGLVQKETQVKHCDSVCDVGFAYIEPSPDSKDCCGYCKQIACVVEAEVFPIGTEWTSKDFCTKYVCTDTDGSVQVKAVTEKCAAIPEENIKNFVVELLPEDGKCCPKQVTIACKENDTVIEVGQTWSSPDDKCITYKCLDKGENDLIIQESIQSCKTECGKGWKYQQSTDSCCGTCVQEACILEDEIWNEGETWKSEDQCTTFRCEKLGEHYSVVSQQESCPSLEDCPPENVYVKGCCSYCNITAESLTQCMPLPIPLDETIGILKVEDCENKHSIANFTECVGSCESSTVYNKFSGMHESECACCQALAYNSLFVELECEGGHKINKKVAVPSKCGCNVRPCEEIAKTSYTHPTKRGRRMG